MRFLLLSLSLILLTSCAITLPIVNKPISFNDTRIDLTKEYLQKRYGINQDNISIRPK
ncbi:MAG: hypothetical protein ACI834_000218, partial [Colwellia sp.]